MTRDRLTLYAQSALLIVGAVMLLVSLAYGVPSVALAVVVFATGVAWPALTVSGGSTVPRKLAGSALVLLLVSGSLIVVRIIAGHAWLPDSAGSVLSFIVAELFLVPAAILLLVVSLVWHLVVRVQRKPASPAAPDAAAANAATALLVLAALLLVGSQVTPRILRPLARDLEWGRYGFGPAVRLTSLRMLTTDVGITFPADAVLLDGEFVGGAHRYVIAKVRISRDSVEAFLKHQPWPFSWIPIARGRDAVAEFRAIKYGAPPLMKQRGWSPALAKRGVFAYGNREQSAPAECWVLIDLDDPQVAVLYIAWSPT